ncbi:MAG: diguanylate cyclase [Anaerolineales bacterium]|nr:diguanylate cyclase [Anaerolineales bacterium]
MEIRFYLKILQRGWWLIVISALVAVNVSLVYSYYITTPMYESVARFIVSPNLQTTDNRDMVNSLEALDNRSIIATYAEVLNSYQIINDAMELLRENPSDYAEYTISATALPEANIIRYSVKGPDPEVAAMLANSIGQYAIDYINGLYINFNITFLDKAVVSEEPYVPRPLQDAGLALLFGLVIGVGMAIFRDLISGTIDQFSKRNILDYESLAFNRAYFERRIRQEIVNQPDAVITFGIIYLNGVQDYYDSLPQTYINKIMRKITDSLRYQLRGNDIVGRWSKLQFCILLPSTEGVSAINRFERIRDMLDQPISLEVDGNFDISLDVRIGFADRQGGESVNVLISQAETALEISAESDEKISMYRVRPFG